MSRTKLFLKNDTDETLEISVPPCEPDRYHGTDWAQNGKLTIPAKGTQIGPHSKHLLGSIGDPGSDESDHWGWVYLYSPKHDDYLQCYVLSKGDNDSGNTAAIDWYRGKKINNKHPNLSRKNVGTLTKDKTGDFTLTYRPAEDFDKKPKPKLPFELKVSAELIQTFDETPAGLTPIYAYALTIRIGPNQLNPIDTRLSASHPVDVKFGGDLVLIQALRTAKLDSQIQVPLAIRRSGAVFTITMPVDSIAATALYLDFDFGNPQTRGTHRVELHPAELVLQRLTTHGFDVDSLAAVTKDMPSAKRDRDSLHAASSMLDQLHGIERHLPRHVQTRNRYITYVELPGSVITLDKDPNLHALQDCCFGVSIEGDAARYYDDKSAHDRIESCKKQCKVKGIESSVLERFDGFWDKVKNFFGQIKDFFVKVIDGIVNVVMRIGEVIYDVVMKIASEAVKAIGWVLENVLGISMDDVVGWLGYLFDWEAIKSTQRHIVDTFESGFQRLLNQRKATKDAIAELRVLAIEELGLERHENKLQFKKGALDKLQGSLNTLRHDYGLDQYKNAQTGMTIGDTHIDTDAPALRWSTDNLTNVVNSDATGSFSQSDIATQIRTVFQRFIDNAQAFWPDIEATGELVMGYFQNVTFDTLLDAICNALMQLLTGLIHLIEDALDLVIDLVFDMLTFLQEALNARLPVPFVGALYQKYIDPTVSQPNLVEMMSLVAAIPITVLSHLVFEHSPFDSLPESTRTSRRKPIRRTVAVMALASTDGTAEAQAKADALDEQTRAGIIAGTFQIISSMLYGGLEANRIPRAPLTPLFLAFKLGADTISYCASTVAQAKYIEANRNDELTSRQKFDIAIAALFVIPRITDLTRLATFLIDATGWSDVRTFCGKVDTVCSILTLGCAVVPDLVFQSRELSGSANPNEERTKVALKGTQLILSLCNGMLAWLREAVDGAPPEVEIPVVVGRGLIQFSNGAFVIARTAYNASLPPTYQPQHHRHGAIYA